MATLADWFSQSWAFFVANRENIVSLATLIGGGIGIYLLTIRTRAANRSSLAALEQAKTASEQAKTAADRHNAQTDADRERRTTESFVKAAELLGSEKLETRLGGIYTLERISQESEREYWPIMETLTAYVREHAPWPPPQSDRAADQQKEPELSREKIRPKTDVQAVLTVLGRRDEEKRKQERDDQRLDLSETDLRGANLWGAHLEHAVLQRAHLEGANLWGAHLEHAVLQRAHLEGANLGKTHLEDAILFSAHLEGVILQEAHLKGARLWNVHLEGANLEDAENLTKMQINGALGNEGTILPGYLESERPARWTKR